MWTTEIIPPDALLYRRIHHNLMVGLEVPFNIPPSAFIDVNGISVDWNKYSTPEQSQQRAKDPLKNGIAEIVAKLVRMVDDLSVDHNPSPENRAHTNINGIQKNTKTDQTEIRKKLARSAKWVIKHI